MKAVQYSHDVIVWWSQEDHAFVADVPDLPECTGKGKTRAEAIKRVEEAMALHDKTLRLPVFHEFRRRAAA